MDCCQTATSNCLHPSKLCDLQPNNYHSIPSLEFIAYSPYLCDLFQEGSKFCTGTPDQVSCLTVVGILFVFSDDQKDVRLGGKSTIIITSPLLSDVGCLKTSHHQSSCNQLHGISFQTPAFCSQIHTHCGQLILCEKKID